jgi:hypothetical protein
MSKTFKIVLACALILSLAVAVGFIPAGNPKEEALQKAASSVGYPREEIKSALLRYERSGEKNGVAEAVLLPASMGIKTPSINPAKVLNDTPLHYYGNREVFYAALRSHGYDDGDMANMPYWQYEQLESRWLLDEALRNSLAASNPELADRDLSHWTYGDYHRFNEQKSTENLAAWFSAEQLAELESRDIRIEDTRPLLKEFYQPETILAQSDETLRTAIEEWYETKLILSLGADWRESAKQ